MKTPAARAAHTGAYRLATNPPQNSTVHELVARTDITELAMALGAPAIKANRCAAWFRGGTDRRALSFDPSRGCWIDHKTRQGGGKLDLIEAATNCNRRDAVAWLANHHGVHLDQHSPAQAQAWRQRRAEAERQAADLAAWRQAERRRLIAAKNHHFDTAACAMACGRILLAEGAAAPESAWDLVWQHALDDLRGDAVEAELDQLEGLGPAELAEYRGRRQQVAA